VRPVAIIGTGQSDHGRRRDDVSQPELVREAAGRALADAGIAPVDVDAVVISNMELFEGRAMPELWVCEGAFANGKPCLKVATGGTSGTSSCIAGFHQAASGLFDVVLVVGFEKHSEGQTQTGMALTDGRARRSQVAAQRRPKPARAPEGCRGHRRGRAILAPPRPSGPPDGHVPAIGRCRRDRRRFGGCGT
jgi:acetyl-CoA acetyltransferase